jgi:predicted ATPase
MLDALTVSNYRSLGAEVHIDFGRLTVLVGRNGSGKSNVLDALRFVSDAMHMGLSGAITARHGIAAVRRWSGGRPFNVAVRLDLSLKDGPAYYAFQLTGSSAEEYEVKSEEAAIVSKAGRQQFRVEKGEFHGPADLHPLPDSKGLALQLVGGDRRFQELVRSLQNIAVYSIFPDTLRTPQKYSPVKPMSRAPSQKKIVNEGLMTLGEPRVLHRLALLDSLEHFQHPSFELRAAHVRRTAIGRPA